MGASERQNSQDGGYVMKWYAALLFATTAVPMYAQARFEVASIRRAAPGATARDARMNFRGDRFEAKASTVGDILDMLNGWQLERVAGGPAWIRTDRYDIEAKAEHEIAPNDRESALMALLAERFRLEAHRETREVAGIVVRVPKIPAAIKVAASDERYSLLGDGSGNVVFKAVPMSSLTNYLSQMWASPVVDETGLKGAYDFVLATSRVDAQPGEAWGDRVRDAMEDLGFRVENRKVPLEVTVVDRCERPSEN